jgi:hypothetical protein
MEKYIDISQEQAAITLKFIESVFSEDVEAYWENISKVDQARVYGLYRSAIITNSLDPHVTFYDYVRDNFKVKHEEQYANVKEYPGLASHVRYTDEGEIMLYVLEDVQVSRTYIAEAMEKVYPVILTIDADIENNEINPCWKVRIYTDQEYKKLR